MNPSHAVLMAPPSCTPLILRSSRWKSGFVKASLVNSPTFFMP